MSDWLRGLEGTPAGHDLALVLALMAAVLHALFGALQKGRHDPWLSRIAIDLSYGLIALPFALFVVPWPEPHMWPIFAGVVLIHLIYKALQAMTYVRGAYTVVYPVVRGTGPLVTVLAAGLVFGETFAAGQWLGLAMLSGGILGLAAWNLNHVTVDRARLVPALWLAVATGVSVAAYTTYDAYGIRATADPFTFLAWLFLLDGLVLPLILHRRFLSLPRAELAPLLRRGVLGAFVAFFSFGSVMLATRLGNVGQVAALRETSVVFAALIGWLVLGEKVGWARMGLIAVIAAGAVLIRAAA